MIVTHLLNHVSNIQINTINIEYQCRKLSNQIIYCKNNGLFYDLVNQVAFKGNLYLKEEKPRQQTTSKRVFGPNDYVISIGLQNYQSNIDISLLDLDEQSKEIRIYRSDMPELFAGADNSSVYRLVAHFEKVKPEIYFLDLGISNNDSSLFKSISPTVYVIDGNLIDPWMNISYPIGDDYCLQNPNIQKLSRIKGANSDEMFGKCYIDSTENNNIHIRDNVLNPNQNFLNGDPYVNPLESYHINNTNIINIKNSKIETLREVTIPVVIDENRGIFFDFTTRTLMDFKTQSSTVLPPNFSVIQDYKSSFKWKIMHEGEVVPMSRIKFNEDKVIINCVPLLKFDNQSIFSFRKVGNSFILFTKDTLFFVNESGNLMVKDGMDPSDLSVFLATGANFSILNATNLGQFNKKIRYPLKVEEIISFSDVINFKNSVMNKLESIQQITNNTNIIVNSNRVLYGQWRVRSFSKLTTSGVLFREDPDNADNFLILFNRNNFLFEVSMDKNTFLNLDVDADPVLFSNNASAIIRNDDFKNLAEFKAGLEAIGHNCDLTAVNDQLTSISNNTSSAILLLNFIIGSLHDKDYRNERRLQRILTSTLRSNDS